MRQYNKRSYANVNRLHDYNEVDAKIDLETTLRHLPIYQQARIIGDAIKEFKGIRKRKPLRMLLNNP